MTEFSLYLDDSGHPDDKPYVIIGGYVATEKQWLAFEPLWRKALADAHLTELHMTDFMRMEMTALKRDAILSRFRNIIHAHTAECFLCAIDMDAYKRVNEEWALEECLGAPAALAARTVAKHIKLWKTKHSEPDDKVLYFIERGTKHYGDIVDVFEKDELLPPAKVPKETPQVQPADMLAWEFLHHLRYGSERKNMKKLLRQKPQFGSIYREKDLIATCRRSNVIPRSDMAANPGRFIAFHTAPRKVRRKTINP